MTGFVLQGHNLKHCIGNFEFTNKTFKKNNTNI